MRFALCVVFLIGCSSTRGHPRVSVLDRDIRRSLQVFDVLEKSPNDLLTVAVTVRNRTDGRMETEYRFVFFDHHHMEIKDPAMPWRRLALEPGEPVQVRANATTPYARGWHLKIRRR